MKDYIVRAKQELGDLTKQNLQKLCDKNKAFDRCSMCQICPEGERSCIKPITTSSSKDDEKESYDLFFMISGLPEERCAMFKEK